MVGDRNEFLTQKLDLNDLNFDEGKIILINKPLEWSSFDIVRKVKNTIKHKVGHAGTLDPLASGLLILCTGKMTKKINEFQEMEKEYVGEMVIGKTTPSCDLETEVNCEKEFNHITEEQIRETVQLFMGKIMQAPPIFSAVKIGGERLYKKARRGEEVKIEPKEIFIREFEILSIDKPVIQFRVVCSKGTYIRSLVRDFGEALQCGAYMSALRRTKIGFFNIEDAHDIHEFVKVIREKQ